VPKSGLEPGGNSLAGPGTQETARSGLEALTDRHDLVGRLALTKNDLGMALAQGPMMIDPRER
jgi:hypothetical protein